MTEYAISGLMWAPDAIQGATKPIPSCLASATKTAKFLDGFNSTCAQDRLAARPGQRVSS